MGCHSFLDRCNHLRQSDKEEVSALTADCHWGETPSHLLTVLRCRLVPVRTSQTAANLSSSRMT